MANWDYVYDHVKKIVGHEGEWSLRHGPGGYRVCLKMWAQSLNDQDMSTDAEGLNEARLAFQTRDDFIQATHVRVQRTIKKLRQERVGFARRGSEAPSAYGDQNG